MIAGILIFAQNEIPIAGLSSAVSSQIPAPVFPQKLENPPEIIRAVYITGWSARSKSYLNYLENLFETTEINAVVVDIKDYSGKISYKSGIIKNIDDLIRFFHDRNIYVIGRISVFEDPEFSKERPDLAIYDKSKSKDKKELWLDNHKLSWLDPSSPEVWDYNISLAKDAFMHGFDEINFDYIRFPSDGKTKNMGFPFWSGKIPIHEVLGDFYAYLREELTGEIISADLFGQTTVNYDDLGIGQIIEDASLYFDYICPMVYPSHFAPGFLGYENPAEYPYEVVKYSLNSALNRIPSVKIRPWLQEFNMGAYYTPEMVRLQIKASKDALKESYSGYMLWSPSNIYSKAY